MLAIEGATFDELFDAIDWLYAWEASSERKFAQRHLAEGGVVLFDVSSINFLESACTLAQVGNFRDHRRDERPQVVEDILFTAERCPIPFDVLAGNTADRMTFASQVRKVRDRYRIRKPSWSATGA